MGAQGATGASHFSDDYEQGSEATGAQGATGVPRYTKIENLLHGCYLRSAIMVR